MPHVQLDGDSTMNINEQVIYVYTTLLLNIISLIPLFLTTWFYNLSTGLFFYMEKKSWLRIEKKVVTA